MGDKYQRGIFRSDEIRRMERIRYRSRIEVSFHLPGAEERMMLDQFSREVGLKRAQTVRALVRWGMMQFSDDPQRLKALELHEFNSINAIWHRS